MEKYIFNIYIDFGIPFLKTQGYKYPPQRRFHQNRFPISSADSQKNWPPLAVVISRHRRRRASLPLLSGCLCITNLLPTGYN
ncbi:hypothetical protein AKJ16_DCAP24660 [Drosera capensis]